eukprot:1179615-Prorocentrum_minimum.AAC.2
MPAVPLSDIVTRTLLVARARPLWELVGSCRQTREDVVDPRDVAFGCTCRTKFEKATVRTTPDLRFASPNNDKIDDMVSVAGMWAASKQKHAQAKVQVVHFYQIQVDLSVQSSPVQSSPVQSDN